eukprot:3436170-Amphidinium_carterae.1
MHESLHRRSTAIGAVIDLYLRKKIEVSDKVLIQWRKVSTYRPQTRCDCQTAKNTQHSNFYGHELVVFELPGWQLKLPANDFEHF